MQIQLYPSKKAAEKLFKLFNEEQFGIPIGRAFVGISILGKDGQRYGSYGYVDCTQLHARHYIVEFWDYRPHILLLDTIFKRTYPQALCYHHLNRQALKMRRIHLRNQSKRS